MSDSFLDCLNVNSFTAGRQKRKPFWSPYCSASDFRHNVGIYFKLTKNFIIPIVVRERLYWVLRQLGRKCASS